MPFEDRGDVGDRKRAEAELLATREDRRQQRRRLHGDEDQRAVAARLLERLEQRVLRLRREQMRVVDDADLRAAGERAEAELALEIADLLDRDVALALERPGDRAHVGMRAGGDRAARVARAAGLERLRLAVQSERERAGDHALADAGGAGEDEGVRETAGLGGAAEVRDGAFVAAHVGEARERRGRARHRGRRGGTARRHAQAFAAGAGGAAPRPSSHSAATRATSALTSASGRLASIRRMRSGAAAASARKPRRTRSWNARSSK